MKKNYVLTMISMSLLIIISIYSCKKEKQTYNPAVTLSNNNILGKSYQTETIKVSISSPVGIKSLIVTKGVNLKQDSSYGVNGVMTITPDTAGQKNWVYTFSYVLQPGEVGKLVGFNFRAVDQKGNASEKDLTVNTTVSGAQLLETYKWKLTNKYDLTSNFQDYQDCETDDYYLFNTDGSMVYGYGAKACTFDGFNVYSGWKLSDDEKTLSITYSSVFNPAQVTTDVYTVKTLTKDQLVMDIYYDLSVFGLSNHELYEFTYTAAGK
jgi:hypothetical protein